MVDWDAEDAVIAAQLQAAKAAGYGEIARQEIHNRYLTAQILGRPAEARKALDTYIRFFTSPELPGFQSQSPFAIINRVGNDTYSIVEFTLEQDTDVDIFAIGEYWLGQMVDYGGIEDVSSGKLIWVMTPDRTLPAGGVGDEPPGNDQIALPAGTYRLHFRTNEAHAFGNWTICLLIPYSGVSPCMLLVGMQISPPGTSLPLSRKVTASAGSANSLRPSPHWSMSILWTCLGILLSALVVIPVALWRSRKPVGTSKKVRGWTKVAAWVMWVNSLLSPLLIFVLMKFFDLELLVSSSIVVSTTAIFQMWITHRGSLYVHCVDDLPGDIFHLGLDRKVPFAGGAALLFPCNFSGSRLSPAIE